MLSVITAGFFTYRKDVMARYSRRLTHKTLLAETATPVSIYLRLRDEFSNSLLLESSDYHARGHSMSFICCDPIAGVSINRGQFREEFPDGSTHSYPASEIDVPEKTMDFCQSFQYEADKLFPFNPAGLFGSFTYNPLKY